MKTVWGKSGSRITLPCAVDLDPNDKFSIDWRKDDQLILSAYGNERGHVTPSLQGRLARDDKLGITIHSVSNQDAGIYQCIVTRFSKQPTKPIKGTSLKLIVNVAPIVNFPKNGEIFFKKHGDILSIECKADGVPSPEITWSKNDQIVSTSAVLSISNLTEGDKGQYSCLAVNVEGATSSYIDLRFTRETTLDLVPINKTVMEGSNLFWHCHANSNPGTIVYSWLFEKKQIKTTPAGLRANIRNGDLSLQDVRKTDAGWYTCEAKNGHGDIVSSSAHLEVLYPPEPTNHHQPVKTIASGRNSSISCDVIANPKPTIYIWSKNGHFLTSQTEEKLSIYNAKAGDNGIYGCQAENIAGKGPIVETHLIVAEPPVFTVLPPSKIKVRQGDQVSVPCQGFGDPMPIVYWIRDKKRLNQSTLNFRAISHEDHGSYQCVVSNSVETLKTETMIIVESTKPQPVTKVRFTCESNYSLKISWLPGYNGGYDQTFAIHAQNEANLQWSTIRTSRNESILENMEPFISYRVTIESQNIKGATNSTTFNRRSCSTLYPPEKLFFCGRNELCWTPADGAISYQVERKMEPGQSYQPIAEVAENYYRLGKEIENEKMVLYRVKSLRPAFQPNNMEISLLLLGGILGSLFLFCCFICLWRLCSTSSKKKKQKSRKGGSAMKTYQEFGRYTYDSGSGDSSHPGTETYYEPSLRLLDEKYEWRGPRDVEPVYARYPQSLVEYDFETGDENPVDDMFRDRYILSADDPPPQLYQDLRLERLRREYKQSQI
ncbi:unnamed protein product [Caenorhabditis bovis]|uniref:Uncharacterized protein n=1 Tax=Caenorhabditis bovis TaxID=2654633 RepID=A0A8S1EH16_9PELO|nr:unnamed protein product [Caenorhabditis bovis]